jgi:hypothetical protein
MSQLIFWFRLQSRFSGDISLSHPVVVRRCPNKTGGIPHGHSHSHSHSHSHMRESQRCLPVCRFKMRRGRRPVGRWAEGPGTEVRRCLPEKLGVTPVRTPGPTQNPRRVRLIGRPPTRPPGRGRTRRGSAAAPRQGRKGRGKAGGGADGAALVLLTAPAGARPLRGARPGPARRRSTKFSFDHQLKANPGRSGRFVARSTVGGLAFFCRSSILLWGHSARSPWLCFQCSPRKRLA